MAQWLVASDIHDRSENVEWMLNRYSQDLNESPLLITGDISSASTAKRVFRHRGPIHVIWGNVDDRTGICRLAYEQFDGKPKLHGDFADIELGRFRVGLIHNWRIASFLADSQRFDYVFCGHNHIWQEVTVGRTHLVNSGTLGGVGKPATFAVIDTELASVTRVEL